MKYLVIFLSLVILASAKVDTKSERFHTMCMWFSHANCNSSHFSSTVCATDGNTYSNICFFHRALCEDGSQDMTIKHFGNC